MMQTYKICDLIVNADFRYNTSINRAEKYLTESSEKADITITYDPAALNLLQKEGPHLSLAECEVIYTCTVFYRRLIDFGGFMLHSSAVVVDDKAYLFSAPSGTGKSTHTSQWLKLFGDRAYILNDDKPAIMLRDGEYFACGTPWSGKSDLNVNKQVKLQGICELERSENNFIEPLDNGTAVFQILNQTVRSLPAEAMNELLTMVDEVITNVPIWRMGCNISTEAAQMAYDNMSK